MKIFNLPSARKRRHKILLSTNKDYNHRDRLKQSYNKCMYVYSNSHNPLTRMKAKKDAEYFKRRLERYK